jgi:hypothetical protein
MRFELNLTFSTNTIFKTLLAWASACVLCGCAKAQDSSKNAGFLAEFTNILENRECLNPKAFQERFGINGLTQVGTVPLNHPDGSESYGVWMTMAPVESVLVKVVPQDNVCGSRFQSAFIKLMHETKVVDNRLVHNCVLPAELARAVPGTWAKRNVQIKPYKGQPFWEEAYFAPEYSQSVAKTIQVRTIGFCASGVSIGISGEFN